MSLVSFNSLPDHSRLWIFNTDRPLSTAENEALRHHLDQFLGQWAAHGSQLEAGWDLQHDHFILVGVDDAKVGPSGCSIDAFTQFIRAAEQGLGLTILDAPEVCFREEGEIRCVSRIAFRQLAAEGAVDESTVVFDNTTATVGELRAGGWERPARDTWHAKAFDLRKGAEASA